MHWQGKIRGPDFSPLSYRLRPVPTGLTDEKDRSEMTIVAEPMTEEAAADHREQTLANEDVVLRALRAQPGRSFAQIASDTGWVADDGRPEKWRVQRTIERLAEGKLVIQDRPGGKWRVSEKGNKELDRNYAC